MEIAVNINSVRNRKSKGGTTGVPSGFSEETIRVEF